MNNEKKISCIITVSSNFNFLRDAVNSLLAQTYNNIEIVIVNDGSVKEVNKIINSINSKKIKLYNCKKIGRGKALNFGIEKSTGDLISILDSDDLSHPQKLEKQINFIENKNDVVCTNFTTDINKYNKLLSLNLTISSNKVDKRQFIFRNPICHSSTLIKKSIFDDYLYDENRNNLFDYDLWIRLNINKKKFIKINEILTYKRIHDNQLYENKKRLFYIFSTFILKLKAFKYFKKNYGDLIFIILTTIYSLIPQKIRILLMGKF